MLVVEVVVVNCTHQITCHLENVVRRRIGVFVDLCQDQSPNQYLFSE